MECNDIKFKKTNFSDLYPVQVGWQKHRPDKSYYYSSKRDYLIHYIAEGKGKAVINNIEYPLEAGQYFLVKKGDKVSYKADHNDPWYYMWVSFDGSFAGNFSKFPPVGNISSEIFMNLMSVFEKKEYIPEYVISQIYLIYIQLSKGYDIKTAAEKIKDYIDNNYEKKLTVDDIARMFNINRKHLSRVFARRFGMSTKKYITRIKMENAVTMLRNGATVKYTAEHLAYDDPFTFSKAFKKEMGYSPKEIKNKSGGPTV